MIDFIFYEGVGWRMCAPSWPRMFHIQFKLGLFFVLVLFSHRLVRFSMSSNTTQMVHAATQSVSTVWRLLLFDLIPSCYVSLFAAAPRGLNFFVSLRLELLPGCHLSRISLFRNFFQVTSCRRDNMAADLLGSPFLSLVPAGSLCLTSLLITSYTVWILSRREFKKGCHNLFDLDTFSQDYAVLKFLELVFNSSRSEKYFFVYVPPDFDERTFHTRRLLFVGHSYFRLSSHTHVVKCDNYWGGDSPIPYFDEEFFAATTTCSAWRTNIEADSIKGYIFVRFVCWVSVEGRCNELPYMTRSDARTDDVFSGVPWYGVVFRPRNRGELSAGILYTTLYETLVVLPAFWISESMTSFDNTFVMWLNVTGKQTYRKDTSHRLEDQNFV